MNEIPFEQQMEIQRQQQIAIQNMFDRLLDLAQLIKYFDFENNFDEADIRCEKDKFDVLIAEFKKLQTEIRVFDLGNVIREMQVFSNSLLWNNPERPENSNFNSISDNFLNLPYDNLGMVLTKTLLDNEINIEPEQRLYFKRLMQLIEPMRKAMKNIHNSNLITLNEVR